MFIFYVISLFYFNSLFVSASSTLGSLGFLSTCFYILQKDPEFLRKPGNTIFESLGKEIMKTVTGGISVEPYRISQQKTAIEKRYEDFNKNLLNPQPYNYLLTNGLDLLKKTYHTLSGFLLPPEAVYYAIIGAPSLSTMHYLIKNRGEWLTKIKDDFKEEVAIRKRHLNKYFPEWTSAKKKDISKIAYNKMVELLKMLEKEFKNVIDASNREIVLKDQFNRLKLFYLNIHKEFIVANTDFFKSLPAFKHRTIFVIKFILLPILIKTTMEKTGFAFYRYLQDKQPVKESLDWLKKYSIMDGVGKVLIGESEQIQSLKLRTATRFTMEKYKITDKTSLDEDSDFFREMIKKYDKLRPLVYEVSDSITKIFCENILFPMTDALLSEGDIKASLDENNNVDFTEIANILSYRFISKTKKDVIDSQDKFFTFLNFVFSPNMGHFLEQNNRLDIQQVKKVAGEVALSLHSFAQKAYNLYVKLDEMKAMGDALAEEEAYHVIRDYFRDTRKFFEDESAIEFQSCKDYADTAIGWIISLSLVCLATQNKSLMKKYILSQYKQTHFDTVIPLSNSLIQKKVPRSKGHSQPSLNYSFSMEDI